MADFGTLSQDTTKTFLDEVDVYLLDGTGTDDWKLIGYTSPEKVISANQEFAELFYGVPQVPVHKKKTKESFNVQFSARQFDEDLFSYIIGGNYATDASGSNITVGTNEPTKSTYTLRFASKREDNKIMALTLYKSRIDLNGDMTVGGVSDFSEIPCMATALHDSSRASTDNMYTWNVWNSDISPTGSVPA